MFKQIQSYSNIVFVCLFYLFIFLTVVSYLTIDFNNTFLKFQNRKDVWTLNKTILSEKSFWFKFLTIFFFSYYQFSYFPPPSPPLQDNVEMLSQDWMVEINIALVEGGEGKVKKKPIFGLNGELFQD